MYKRKRSHGKSPNVWTVCTILLHAIISELTIIMAAVAAIFLRHAPRILSHCSGSEI